MMCIGRRVEGGGHVDVNWASLEFANLNQKKMKMKMQKDKTSVMIYLESSLICFVYSLRVKLSFLRYLCVFWLDTLEMILQVVEIKGQQIRGFVGIRNA